MPPAVAISLPRFALGQGAPRPLPLPMAPFSYCLPLFCAWFTSIGYTRNTGNIQVPCEEGIPMISYEPLWQTMKQREMSTYALIKDYGFSRGTLDTLKKGENVSTGTLNKLCKILNCNVEEILRYIPD